MEGQKGVKVLLKPKSPLTSKTGTTVTSSVADPDLQIGGGGGGHPDPEIRGYPVSKKIFSGPSGLILVKK